MIKLRYNRKSLDISVLYNLNAYHRGKPAQWVSAQPLEQELTDYIADGSRDYDGRLIVDDRRMRDMMDLFDIRTIGPKGTFKVQIEMSY